MKIEKLNCRKINFENRIALIGILNRKDEYVTHGEMQMTIYAMGKIFPHEFQIVDDSMNLDADGIIGADFLLKYECVIDYEHGRFLMPLQGEEGNETTENGPSMEQPITKAIVHTGESREIENTSWQAQREKSKNQIKRCETIRVIKISARSESIIEVPCELRTEVVCGKQEIKRGLFIGNTIARPENGMVKVAILNTNEKNMELGIEVENIKYMPLSDFDIIKNHELNRLEAGEKEMEDLIDLSHCNNDEKRAILAICKEFRNIFYMPGDTLGCTNRVQHRIQHTY